jgi:uncharacterized OsmC-like protein
MTAPTIERLPLNGVDVPALFTTLDAVRDAPDAARFQFRAVNRWVSGNHSRTMIDGYFGTGQEHQHRREYVLEADHPAVLVGTDRAASPVEAVLHSLAACLTAGIGNIASARGIELTAVESRLEGDIDLRGLLGLSDEVRNGFERIRVHLHVTGNATDEQLRAVVEQSRARSAVFDIVTSGVPIDIDVQTD